MDVAELGERGYADVVERLAAAGCVAPREEAAEICASATDAAALEAGLRRRERGEPLAWITGSTVFCGRRLHVDPGVYEPRAQTEALARRAAALVPAHGCAVDLCTGSGAVAAHLRAEVPAARVVATDADPRAAACARRNGVPAVVADLAAPLRSRVGTWVGVDVVTAVAPYVPTGELHLLPADVRRYEPRAALDGGPDGLDVVRRVVRDAARVLRRGGWLLVELGGDQDTALTPDLAAAGFAAMTSWRDEAGDLRGIAAAAVPGPHVPPWRRIRPTDEGLG